MHMLIPVLIAAVQTITLTAKDGGHVCADVYGPAFSRGVVLAHGGMFTKESWRSQAEALAAKGFHVVAIDFRGFGCSKGPGQQDFDHAPPSTRTCWRPSNI